MSEWISVDDRFVGRAGRARSKAVLVYCPSNICIFTACFNFEEQKWEHFAPGAYDLREKVTHWMPLPEPPEDR
jgi:hypothetical protein